MTYRVFKELKDNLGEFVSGEKLSKKLNISRVAINKHIVKLKSMGYQIHSNTKSGYKYLIDDDILSEYSIRYTLSHYGIDDIDLHFFDELTSTNTACKSIELNGKVGLVVSKIQTGGKGRRGRNFASNEDGIYMSLIYSPTRMKINKGLKSVLLAGVSVCELLKEYGINANLKYPNDVIVNGKKICGILCEMVSDAEYIEKLIIGIGINVNNDSFEEPIKKIAISMKNATDKCFMRDRIIGRLASVLIERLKAAEIDDFEETLEEYRKYSNTLGEEIKVIEDENNFYYGKAVDIDDDGFLIVETDNGEKRVVSADVSIRGKKND